MAPRGSAPTAAMATLLATVLVPPPARAEPPKERLAAYLGLVRQYRAADAEAAAALMQWSLGDVERAVGDLTSHPERVDSCDGTGGTIALVEVEAAALLEARVATHVPVDHPDDAQAHMREARRLVEFAHDTRHDSVRGRTRSPAREGCDPTPRVRRRDLYAATAGLFLRRAEYRLALESAQRGLDIAPDDTGLLLAAASAHEQVALGETWHLGWRFLAPASPADRAWVDWDARDRVDELERESTRAQELLRRALARQPDLAPARLRLGRLLAQQGFAQRAERELLVATHGTDAEVRYLAELFLGGLREESADLGGAESHYRRAIAAHPQSQTARLALAHVLGLTGRPDAARTLVLETLSAVWPRDPGADPWWQYAFGPWPEAVRLFAAMEATVRLP